MRFKKVDPNCHMASNGNSFGVAVETTENVDGKEVIITKSSQDVYPPITNPEEFSLENQIRSGVPLKEVTVEKLQGDVDRLDEQFNAMSSRVEEMETSLTETIEE